MEPRLPSRRPKMLAIFMNSSSGRYPNPSSQFPESRRTSRRCWTPRLVLIMSRQLPFIPPWPKASSLSDIRNRFSRASIMSWTVESAARQADDDGGSLRPWDSLQDYSPPSRRVQPWPQRGSRARPEGFGADIATVFQFASGFVCR